jgi:gluconokinase
VAREAAEGLASGIPPGSEGLLFLPYLTGEGSPDWNPRTRGAFFGLSLNHGKGHLLRAVLEGITRSIERAVDRLRAIGAQEFTEVRVTGGLTASDTWLQIAADMLGIPVRVPMSPEGSARGAALLGLTALGRITDLEKVAQRLTFRKVVEPRPAIHARYEEQGAVFEDLLECSRRIHQPEETSQ